MINKQNIHLLLEQIDNNYDKDVEEFFEDQDREKVERIMLSAIKELSGFDYDAENKLFTRAMEDKSIFASEVVEIENIHSYLELYNAIDHLNQAYHIRTQSLQQKNDMTLPDRLYKEPEQIQEISRENVETFLRESYQIESETELGQLDRDQYKEVVYDMYRTFTGCVPLKDGPKGVFCSLPQDKEMRVRFTELPDFAESTDLFSHIRDMRRLKKHIKELHKEVTAERLQEFKSIAQEQEQDQEQEL